MGSIQALSRSTYAKFLPETEDTASYFSFYDSAEKWGIVLGTFLYGAVAQYTGDMRIAIAILGLFFVLGILLLRGVKEPDQVIQMT
jgi:UMF1 family MFS transporter